MHLHSMLLNCTSHPVSMHLQRRNGNPAMLAAGIPSSKMRGEANDLGIHGSRPELTPPTCGKGTPARFFPQLGSKSSVCITKAPPPPPRHPIFFSLGVVDGVDFVGHAALPKSFNRSTT